MTKIMFGVGKNFTSKIYKKNKFLCEFVSAVIEFKMFIMLKKKGIKCEHNFLMMYKIY